MSGPSDWGLSCLVEGVALLPFAVRGVRVCLESADSARGLGSRLRVSEPQPRGSCARRPSRARWDA